MTWPVRSVRFALLLFAMTLLGLAGTLAPAAAVRADDTIAVNWVNGPLNEPGLLEVSLTSSSAITSLSVALFASGSTTPIMTLSDFSAPTAGPDGSQIYAIPASIPWGNGAGQLPLGDYAAQVTASDQGGTAVTSVPAGTFDFEILPAMTMRVRPATVDWGNRAVSFSGSVTGTFPDGSTGPLAGVTVTIEPLSSGTGQDIFAATTGDDGKYSVVQDVLAFEFEGYVSGSTAPGVDTQQNTVQIVNLKVKPDQVKLTATLAAASVNYGKSDKITGTVRYKSGSTWRPLAKQTVLIGGDRPGDNTTAETNSAGHYAATLADLKASDSWTISAGLYSAWFNGASITKTITVNLPVKLVRVKEKLSPFGVLSASGCIAYKDPADQNDTSTAPIWVDYAAGPKDPWHPLGKMKPYWNGTQMCPTVGSNWSGQFGVKLANAWYRERVAAGSGVEGTVSKPMHLRKTLTRIIDFSVSSRDVPEGGSLTVSGRLESDSGHWRSFKNQVVLIVLRPKGKKTWYWIAKPRTTASGDFSATFADPVSATGRPPTRATPSTSPAVPRRSTSGSVS